MKVFIGIDLGSTTTKAVILDREANVVGRGITNSRSNYDVASQIARQEAFVQARFKLTHFSQKKTLGCVVDKITTIR